MSSSDPRRAAPGKPSVTISGAQDSTPSGVTTWAYVLRRDWWKWLFIVILTVSSTVWAIHAWIELSMNHGLRNRPFTASAVVVLSLYLAFGLLRVERKAVSRRPAVPSLPASPVSAREVDNVPLSMWAPYSDSALDILVPLDADGSVTRESVVARLRERDVIGAWDRLDLRMAPRQFRTPSDSLGVTGVVLFKSDGGASSFKASDELASCLSDAERLVRAYGFDSVLSGHLAGVLVLNATGSADLSRDILTDYFGTDFVAIDDVLLYPHAPALASEPTVADARIIEDPVRSLPTEALDRSTDQQGRTAMRWIWAVSTVVLMVVAWNTTYSRLPDAIRDARVVTEADEALSTGTLADANRLYTEVFDRRPTSTTAAIGIACSHSRAGDAQGWAVFVQIAMLITSSIRELPCVPLVSDISFYTLSFPGFSVVYASELSAPTLVSTTTTPTQVGIVIAEAACMNGALGLEGVAGLQALVVLDPPFYSRIVQATISDCVEDWPAGSGRDQTLAVLDGG